MTREFRERTSERKPFVLDFPVLDVYETSVCCILPLLDRTHSGESLGRVALIGSHPETLGELFEIFEFFEFWSDLSGPRAVP